MICTFLFEKYILIDPKVKACFNKTRGVGKTDKKMAFENCDVVFSKEHFDHIQERHVRLDLHPQASKFRKNFHLVSCLAPLTKRTCQASDEYEIIDEGFRRGHGHYYMYVFTLCKVIGTDPWGFPTKKICIYYAWQPWMDGRFHIILVYPYSSSYHHQVMCM